LDQATEIIEAEALLEPEKDGRPKAPFVPAHADVETWVFVGDGREALQGSVRGSIIDDKDVLDPFCRKDGFNEGANVLALVENRDYGNAPLLSDSIPPCFAVIAAS
jgi:hypothetical protein